MRLEARTVRVPAYAKLNLGLRVLYKRPDGYHELRTVFQTISLADRLEIHFAPARAIRIAIECTPEIPDNLVERACRYYLEAVNIQADVRFILKKNIPQGGGLGGGSSDAAAVLLALQVLTRKTLPPDQLHAIAAQLGSDVPFFLHGGTALGLGRGEELYPLPDRTGRGLLVVPAVHSSTAEAYRDLSSKLISSRLTSIGLQNKLSSFQQAVWRGSQRGDFPGADEAENDFEEGVFARYPELKQIKERLSRFGAKPAAMTGSGSAIFGIFADPVGLARARKSLQDTNQDTDQATNVFPISFISRARYRSVWRTALNLQGNLWPPQNRSDRNQYE